MWIPLPGPNAGLGPRSARRAALALLKKRDQLLVPLAAAANVPGSTIAAITGALFIVNKVLLLLVIAAIVVGNSAYQGGNISGAALGAEALFGDIGLMKSWHKAGGINLWALLLGCMAALVLWFGQYKLIERCLIVLVLLMSLAFIGTMLLTKPDLPALLKGAFWPLIPPGAVLNVVALIGTTVVPYSLFLHAAAAA